MQADNTMTEIRLVGRGGQGVVTAGDLIGKAALIEGRWAQSLPTFGPERRGALTLATLRIGENEILLKCTAARPKVLLVLDPTVWHHANVLLGLREGADLIFNTPADPNEIETEIRDQRYGYGAPVDDFTVYTVDATGIALEVLGKPITNTAMIGAFAAVTSAVKMTSIEHAFTERFEDRAAANIAAARAAGERIRKAENGRSMA